MKTSNCKVEAITSKGHKFFRFRQAEVRWSKRAKKTARRAQRRDNHKEIEAQLAVEEQMHNLGYAVWQVALVNVFSPVPEFAMTDWERSGMEWYRHRPNLGKIKFRICWDGHNYPPIQDIPRWCNGSPKIDTDETLFETLQRSVNRELT